MKLRRLRVSTVLLAALLVAGTSPIGRADDESLVRTFLEQQIGALASAAEAPVIVSWERRRRTTLSPREIEQRWSALEPYPDHPDRHHIEYHRRLLRQPEHVEGTIRFAGGGAWLVQESRDTGYYFRAGGTPDTRWMLASRGEGGQLTITREGVPFPGIYNVSRFYDLNRQRVSLLLHYGLGTISDDGRIASISVADGRWTADILDRDRQIHAEGLVDDASQVVRIMRVRIQPTDSSTAAEEYRFQRHARDDAVGRVVPRVVTAHRTDEIEDIYNITRLAPMTREKVVAAAAVPDPPEGVDVADFTQPDSELWSRYAGGTRVTWHRRDNEDRFEVEPATGDAGSFASASAQPHLPGYARALALGLALLTVVVVPLIFYRLRRH